MQCFSVTKCHDLALDGGDYIDVFVSPLESTAVRVVGQIASYYTMYIDGNCWFFVYVFKTLCYLSVLVSSSTLLLFQWNTYISVNLGCLQILQVFGFSLSHMKVSISFSFDISALR